GATAPAPVAVNRLSAAIHPAAPAGPGNGVGVAEVLAQQLATLQSVMQAQLALLAGAPPAEASAPAAAQSAAPVETPRPASDGTAADGTGTGVAGAPPQAPQTSGAPLPAARVSAAPAPEADAPAAHGPHRPVRQTLNQHGGFTERQARHFDALVQSYTARTRRSKEYAARHRPRLSDNRASLNFRLATKELMYPIVGDRSQGSRMWDVDGNEYIDFTIGFGVHFFGHRPPFVVQAVEAQLARGYHTGPQSDVAGPVADLFSELTGMERATFCNTGSEAVMTALRIARTVTGRDTIVLFEGSYHGCFDGIMARRGTRTAGAAGAPSRPASPGTPQGMVDDVVVLRYGAPDALEWIRAHAGELAAVLVEPVRTADPEFQPREFLREVREITAAAGTVLIFDEMITGLRLQLRGAQGWLGVEADLATYGKVIGGGFPLGVVAGKAYLMDAIDGGQWSFGDDSYPAADQTFFAGTFCKHPVTMAAAHAILLHLQERGQALYDDLHARASRLVTGLRAVLAEEGVPLRIMHSASFFRFVPNRDDQYLDLLFYHMLERGIYVWEGRACFLCTAHTDEDCDRMVQALRESIAALHEGGFLPEKPGGGGASAPAKETAGTATIAGAPALKMFAAPEVPAPVRSHPLTAPQRAVWAHAQFGDDASRAYNQEFVVGVRGRLDVEALRAALGDLVAHHEGLRAVFDPAGDRLHVLPALRGPVPLYPDDAAIGADPGAEGVARLLREAAHGVFDLAEGPLFRVHLHARGPDRQVLQFIVHHIAADGQAIDLLKRDLDIAYRARAEGRAPRLPEAMQLGEYATLVAEHTTGAARAEAEWLGRFSGMRPLVLPTDRPRPTVPTHRARTARFRLEAPLAHALRERSRTLGVTLFTTLLTGVLAALHRMAGQDDLVIGISSAGRPLAGMESVVAHCVDALPIRSRLNGPRRMAEFLKEVRGWLLDAFEDEFFSYARLYE
ncbi:MAG: aminotransferase class III-fold pyridoxal phosphate-dependent enzyme, partial [Longimicrobiaceae bacterium]